MPIGAVIAGVSAIVGAGTAIFGASEGAKASKASSKEQAAQASANSKAAKNAAKYSKKIISEQSSNVKAQLKTMDKQLRIYGQISKSVTEEQEVRKRDMFLDAETSRERTMESYLLAYGEALNNAGSAGAGSSSFVMGSLGSLWTSRNRALQEVNWDVQTGLDIFSEQKTQAELGSKSNRLATEQNKKNLKSGLEVNKLSAKMNAASVPTTVSTSGSSALMARANLATGISAGASALGTQSVANFANQIFGT